MRICLLADAQSPHTARWSAFFHKQGHDVHIVSFRPAELAGVQVHCFGWGKRLGKLRYLLYPVAIRKLVRRLQPDILHAHHATSYGLVGALCNWHPYLIHTWGRDVLDFPRYRVYRALVGFNLRRADLITCTSQVMTRAVERLAQPNTPIYVVPFGVDLTRFRPRPHPKSPGEPTVIGTARSLEKLYGIEYLLRAFGSLFHQNGDLRLLIVGDGTQRPVLESLASELKIAGSTRFAGRVPHEQVIRYLHEMDIFVVPSLQESFGVAAVEAAAAGLPVVASSVGGLPEVVVDGETGFLVPPADIEALRRRLSQLITDPALRQRMGQAGRAFVKAHYDWQVNATQMERLYQSLVKG
jgi:glycosyltransferase involved in cell wall biosynthesis